MMPGINNIPPPIKQQNKITKEQTQPTETEASKKAPSANRLPSPNFTGNISPIARVNSPVQFTATTSSQAEQYNKNKLTRTRKVLSFPDSTPIYLYKGHGSDICDANGPVIGKVPENCIYITFGICGNTTLFNKRELELFSSQDPEIKEIITKPYILKNRQKLAQYLGISVDDIIIRYPGDSYVYNFFQPISYWFRKNQKKNYYWKLSASGLLDKKLLETKADPLYFDFEVSTDFKSDPVLKNDQEYLRTVTMVPFNDIVFKKHRRDLRHEFMKIFNIQYPGKTTFTKDEVFLALQTFVANTLPMYLTEEAKNMALRIQKIDQEFLQNPRSSYPKEELELILMQYLSFTPAYNFSKFYDCSVYPTRNQIESMLSTNNIQFVNSRNINQVIEAIYNTLGTKPANVTNPQTSTLTNAYLMQKFPGIHYNTICRTVSKECEALTIPRRSVSETQFKNTQKYTDLVLGSELKKTENILYKDANITIVKPGTIGSIPILKHLSFSNTTSGNGSCDTSINLNGSNFFIPPTNPIPIDIDQMTLDQRIQTLYGKSREDIASMVNAEKLISVDIDPTETYIEGRNQKILVSDYLKNPNPQYTNIDIKVDEIPSHWLSSCYEHSMEGFPVEPQLKPYGYYRGFIADFEKSENKKAEVEQARKNLNTWNSYYKELEAFQKGKKNKSQYKNTKKYGGKRKNLKKKRRTYKK